MRDEYTAEVIDTLESTFGELNDKETLAVAIESAARNAVEDNIPDYLSDLIYSVKDSFLDGVSEEEITHIFKKAVRNSVAYMTMTRLGIEAGEYFEPDDLRDVVNFTTPATLNALGYATHWYPVFYVMANTGMRVGEITGLRWSDIDLKKGIIRVNHTLVYYNHRDEKGCYFSINTPKTKAGEREIPMTEGVKQAFLMEREFQSQAEISSKSRVDGYDDFIFVNRYGDVQNQGNLNKALRRMMRDCNDEILEKYGADSDPVLLPQFSCHILRHTFATRLCESGANLKFIQSILGHADVSTTMNIYVDVTDALKKKEITAFDDYMTTKLET